MGVLFVIFGILLTVSGVSSLFFPVSSALSTGLFIGVFMGVMFISNGINGLFSHRKEKSFWNIVLDILMIILGIFIICTDAGLLTTTTFVIIYLGASTFVAGISRIIIGIKLKKAGFHCGWVIFSAILSVLAGSMIMANPLTGLFTVDYMTSFIAIVMGCNMVAAGFKFKKEK